MLKFSVLIATAVVVVHLVPTVSPVILNSLLNLENDTLKKSLSLEIEYFVDLDEHYLLPFLHCYFSTTVLFVICSAFGTFYIHGIYYNIGVWNAIRSVVALDL